MRLTSSRVGLLLAHGLSDSEARVYLALLEHPGLPAATLAKMTSVPRSHLYTVLQDLHAHGLVDVLLDGKSRLYRAKPISDFLDKQAAELRGRLAEVEHQRATMAEAFQPPPYEAKPEDAGEMQLLIGRRAVAREIDNMLQDASARIVIGASSGSVERVGRHLASALEATPGGSTRFHVHLPPGAHPEMLGGDVASHPRVTTSRLRTALPTLGVAKDGAGMLFVHPIPDAPDLRAGRDVAVLTTDAAFSATYVRLLEAASDC